ncbi:MAG: glycogen/starch synthase [Chloroflexota bacterium]
MAKTIRVLFLAAEADPFVKVGGLGDVAAALPRALRNLSAEARGDVTLDVRLALPHHAVIKAEARPLAIFPLPRGDKDVAVQVSESNVDGMPVYLIGGEPIAAIGSVYSSNAALDTDKYAFFSLAALQLPRILDWRPDIIHAHDWHTALAAYALLLKRWDGEMAGVASVVTIHNLPFMGADATEVLKSYNLPVAQSDLPDWARSLPLPLGLFAADAAVAVSPTYAEEILTPKFGCGLEDFLHRRKEILRGILNGIDTVAFDPANDALIPFQYTIDNPAIREKNKTALQEKLGLPVDANIPLFGMVTRMDKQKGVDLLLEVFARLNDLPWQFVLLGTGDPELETAARALQKQLPERVRAEMRFDAALARHIYAGADMFPMPSRYEPCGLAQMIAMRYGCLPIVHATGGLNDTVTDAVGFRFKSATPRSLRAALLKALTAYSDRERWLAQQKNAMREDFSWGPSAKQYLDLYESLMSKPK